jgi:hypothetical protein
MNVEKRRDASYTRDASHSRDAINSRDATMVETAAGPQQQQKHEQQHEL